MDPSKQSQVSMIDTPRLVSELVDLLVLITTPQSNMPSMYIDLEGVNLCREGSVSILSLQVYSTAAKGIFLIDVHTLGAASFNTAGLKNRTLKHILEDPSISKVFFDVRNDSDALFAHYGIALQGVKDLQLMESATRKTTQARRLLSGLNKFITNNYLPDIDRASWKLAKAAGEKLFRVDRGGSYEVFNIRPMPSAILAYCTGDVRCLPGLYERFDNGNVQWCILIDEASQQRVADSQKPKYKPHGRHKVFAPWTRAQNRLLDQLASAPQEENYFQTDAEFNDYLME
jgi:exonuclease 3'-5' domain-containing protein 1